MVQGILTEISCCAADLKECGGDRKKLARQEAVAAMCLGEDAEEVGGVRSNETWFDQQKTNACGKLQVCLLKFLMSLCIRAASPPPSQSLNPKLICFLKHTWVLFFLVMTDLAVDCHSYHGLMLTSIAAVVQWESRLALHDDRT